ncbi:MAG: hypothetical protein J7L15_02475 [Clostridiales bacterium]|nr:hypothetical protein [Clostridiales bacterium]
MKRENRKINKSNLTEVSGNRTELKPYLGDTFEVDCFVTNTNGYLGDKRLINEVYLKDLYIKHIWMKSENVGNLDHGYQKLKVKVTKYTDYSSKEVKYGLRYIGKNGKKFINSKLVIPTWMKR